MDIFRKTNVTNCDGREVEEERNKDGVQEDRMSTLNDRIKVQSVQRWLL